MGLRKLSDVAVGEIITIGGSNYKIDTNTGHQVLVRKQVAAGIFESQKRGIGTLIQGYEGAEYHLVNVVDTKKNDLTSQLRAQVKGQSLTDSLRAQVEQASSYTEDDIYGDDDWDDEDDEEEEEDDDYYAFRGAESFYGDYNLAHSHAYSHVSMFDGVNNISKEVEEAKQSSLTANLRAQSAQQVGSQARLDAAIAKQRANEVREDASRLQSAVNSLGYEIGSLDDRVSDVAHEIESVADVAYDAQDAAYEAINRVAAIEQKQKAEALKVDIQNQLNQKLAQAKQQADVQAQLNAKLNQKSNKTIGGNGTMKNLFGAFKNQFGKVEGKFAFSITTGGLALRKGISQNFVAFEPATRTITDVTGLTLDFNVPAFKLPTAADEVKVGDIVLNGADFGYVTKVNDGYVEVVVPEKNANGSVLPTTNPIFGKAFYTVVKTLDAAGQGGFNPALLLALGDGNKDELVKIMALTGGFGGAQGGAIDPTMLMLLGDNMDDLLPLMLMQQGGVASQGFNPLMLLAMKDGGSKDKLLPLMMMGQQGGGNFNPMMMLALGDGELDLTTLALMGGFNGQGGLFGGAPAAPQAQAKDVKGNK